MRGLRLMVPTTRVLDGLDADVARCFERALSRLSAAGALITETPVPAFARLGSINAKGGLVAAEAWAWHRPHLAAHADRYDPRVRSRILRGKDMSAADYIDVVQARAAWIAEVEALMAAHDAAVMPTVPIVAPTVAATDRAETRASDAMRRPQLLCV